MLLELIAEVCYIALKRQCLMQIAAPCRTSSQMKRCSTCTNGGDCGIYDDILRNYCVYGLDCFLFGVVAQIILQLYIVLVGR